MDSETRRVYDRMRLYVLMQDHPEWRPEAFTQVIDRTVRWVRKWQKRFADDKTGALAMFLSRSRAPLTRPRQTSPEVKQVVGQLREQLSAYVPQLLFSHSNSGGRSSASQSRA